MQLLLDGGSDPEAKNWNGMTALLIAVEQGFEEVVNLLLAHQVNSEVADQYGRTAIYWAIKGGNHAITTSLLNSGARIDAKTHKGRTALMKSVSRGNEGLIGILTRRGASCQEQDVFGWTALHLASEKGNKATLDALSKDKGTLDIKTNGGQTALMVSARHGHATIVEDLISAGASLDEQDVYGRTALYLAAENSESAVEVLLKYKANLETESNRRQTALMKAASHGFMTIVRTLLNAGASYHKRNEGGWTALQLAIGHMRALEGDALSTRLGHDSLDLWNAWKRSLLGLGKHFYTEDEGTNPNTSDSSQHSIYYDYPETDSMYPKSFSEMSLDADGHDEDGLISFLAQMQKSNLDLLPVGSQPYLKAFQLSGIASFRQSSINSRMDLVFKGFYETFGNYRTVRQNVECLAHPVLRQHPNIINVEGICFDIHPDKALLGNVRPTLVFERSPLGDLRVFMASHEGARVLVEDRLRLCSDIGSALMTLHACSEYD